MSMRLGIGLGLPHVSRAGGTAAWAPGGSFNYYVDGIAGSDGNDGSSPEQAWATFAPLRTAVLNLTTGQTRTAIVRAGTYTDQHLSLTNNASPRAEVTISFEEGTAMVWQSASAPGNGVGTGGTLKLTAYGNGCTITGFKPSSGNGLGANNTGYLIAHDFIIDDADDGVSAHSTSRVDIYDSVFRNCTKAAFSHVNSAICNAYRCTFEGRAGATQGIGAYNNTSSGVMEDCIFTPASAAQPLTLGQGGVVTLTRCRIGTLATCIDLVATVVTLAVNDSFINVNVDGNRRIAFEGCYGRMTTRARNGGYINISHCVLVGGGTGLVNSVLFRNFDPGSHGTWNVIDSVLTGFGTAVGHDFGATDAGYFEAAGNSVTYCCLNGNSVNISTAIVATTADVSTGVITTAPQLGPANSYVKNDYAVAGASPCVGAGSAGGDIGFQAAA